MNLTFLKQKEFAPVFRWFLGYSRGKIKVAQAQDRPGMVLKWKHSLRVAHEACQLGHHNPELPFRALMFAALLHDIGRFAQIEQYHTMIDLLSKDHAAISVSVLHQEEALKWLPDEERCLIMGAIGVHNRKTIPETYLGTLRALSLALRDADKLDIFRVVLRALSPDKNVYQYIFRYLEKGADYSQEVANQILDRQIVRVDSLLGLNDRLLLIASWIYDMNYQSTLQTLAQRGWLQTLLDYLPDDGLLDLVKAQVLGDLEDMSLQLTAAG